MTFTILGASGFIGSHLLAHLESQGTQCFAPRRGDSVVFERELGHVVYCVGLTADFREHPFEAVEAHVTYLADVLRNARFDTLLYLSSTRVYAGAATTAEDSHLGVSSLDPDQLYNLSKLTGESLCFAAAHKQVRVVRLSNVYGFDPASRNFLGSLIHEALTERKVVLKTTLDSARDYISIEDVVQLLPQVALQGRDRIYNVASGTNISNATIAELLQHATGCRFEVAAAARRVIYPVVDNRRLRNEFGFAAQSLVRVLPALLKRFKNGIP